MRLHLSFHLGDWDSVPPLRRNEIAIAAFFAAAAMLHIENHADQSDRVQLRTRLPAECSQRSES
jgi:hypothetical protein